MLLSCSAKKVTKEGGLRGHFEKACPLKKPLRRIAVRCPEMSRFLDTYHSKASNYLHVDARKSEHFRVSARDAAGGVHRGGRIFVAPPLCRLLLVLFLPVKKRTLPYCSSQKGILYLKMKKGGSRPSPTMWYYLFTKKASISAFCACTLPCWKAGLPPPRPLRALVISLPKVRRSPFRVTRQNA